MLIEYNCSHIFLQSHSFPHNYLIFTQDRLVKPFSSLTHRHMQTNPRQICLTLLRRASLVEWHQRWSNSLKGRVSWAAFAYKLVLIRVGRRAEGIFRWKKLLTHTHTYLYIRTCHTLILFYMKLKIITYRLTLRQTMTIYFEVVKFWIPKKKN